VQLRKGYNSENIGNDGYWVAYIQLGYQADIDEDGDHLGGYTTGITVPENCPQQGCFGSSATSSNNVPKGGIGLFVFVESVKDAEVENGNVGAKKTTTAHELGHHFGLDHGSGLGIMSTGSNLGNARFVPQHINILRWRERSPGR
jgi:hypothetical protein